MSYTKGPWKWFDYPDGRKLLAAPARAVIHCPDAPMGIEPSDAALIAAAPDLLEALKEILTSFESGAFVRDTSGDGASEWAINLLPHLHGLAKAKQAIEKTEGR